MLALSALLLFLSDWNVLRASALYCRLRVLEPIPDGLDGNLIGLNPFHDYLSWQAIAMARRIVAKRTDNRPVSDQIAAVKAEMQAQFHEWNGKR